MDKYICTNSDENFFMSPVKYFFKYLCYYIFLIVLILCFSAFRDTIINICGDVVTPTPSTRLHSLFMNSDSKSYKDLQLNKAENIRRSHGHLIKCKTCNCVGSYAPGYVQNLNGSFDRIIKCNCLALNPNCNCSDVAQPDFIIFCADVNGWSYTATEPVWDNIPGFAQFNDSSTSYVTNNNFSNSHSDLSFDPMLRSSDPQEILKNNDYMLNKVINETIKPSFDNGMKLLITNLLIRSINNTNISELETRQKAFCVSEHLKSVVENEIAPELNNLFKYFNQTIIINYLEASMSKWGLAIQNALLSSQNKPKQDNNITHVHSGTSSHSLNT